MPTAKGYTHIDHELIPEGATFTRSTKIAPGKDWSFALKAHVQKYFLENQEEIQGAEDYEAAIKKAMNAYSRYQAYAMSTGTESHSLFEDHINGKPTIIRDLPFPKNEFMTRFVEWWEEQDIFVVGTEIVAVNVDLEYAATIDLVGRENGELWTYDWKTSPNPKGDNRIWPTTSLQLVAGLKAWNSMHPDDPVVGTKAVKFPAKGKVKEKIIEPDTWPDHFRCICNMLGVLEWEREYG